VGDDQPGFRERVRTEIAVRRRSGLDRDVRRQILRAARPVTAPLALISQMQRSGGTLLNHLLDGHPACLTHPPELYVGYPAKHLWPELDLRAGPRTWFTQLYDDKNLHLLDRGYHRTGADTPPLPYLVPARLQREIFGRLLRRRPPRSSRDILDAYFTAYFAAWLDRQRGDGRERYVVGFVPGLIADAASTDRLRQTYPDGRLLSIVREPVSWYASTKHHKSYPSWRDHPDQAAGRWARATSEALRRQDELGRDRVLLLAFETLTRDRERANRIVCDFLGIDTHPAMDAPTFNGHPMAANTSFSRGLRPGDESARARILPDEDRAMVQHRTSDLYAQARDRCEG
jgi:hypothetical protein